MLTVATLLWDPNHASLDFSRCYNEEWVERLFRGFKRNLTVPFTFFCYVDRYRDMSADISQVLISDNPPTYASCIEPFSLGGPMILCGLDTVLLRNIDHLAEYCMTADKIALPRDPYNWRQACNGVCLIPAGNEAIYSAHKGENDMEWLRSKPHAFIDDLWPWPTVKSYKGHVLGQTGFTMRGKMEPMGLTNVDIVYLHGNPKQNQLLNELWIQEHWL